MDDILLFQPSNMQLPPGSSQNYVSGDVYDICERIKELDRNLRVVPLPSEHFPFGIALIEDDGTERLIFRAKVLDDRVIKRVRYIMGVPFEQRLAVIDKEIHRDEVEEKERQLEDLYDRMGGEMWHQLERCGFSQRPVSYPKRRK